MSERENAPDTVTSETVLSRTTEPEATEARTASNYRPSGAIFVTTLVTVVTLVLWLGTFILNLARG